MDMSLQKVWLLEGTEGGEGGGINLLNAKSRRDLQVQIIEGEEEGGDYHLPSDTYHTRRFILFPQLWTQKRTETQTVTRSVRVKSPASDCVLTSRPPYRCDIMQSKKKKKNTFPPFTSEPAPCISITPVIHPHQPGLPP